MIAGDIGSADSYFAASTTKDGYVSVRSTSIVPAQQPIEIAVREGRAYVAIELSLSEAETLVAEATRAIQHYRALLAKVTP